MKDKVLILMEETGCDAGEAELALELCGYDVESAVQAVPRLFQNIVVLKARFCARSESLYGLWLAILNLKDRSLLRARSVVSYNPAVFASELDQHWFDFEARLYACRLWVGTLQEKSLQVEQALSAYFGSPEARGFYEEGAIFEGRDFGALQRVLAACLGGAVELKVLQDVLDMGQFQEVRPRQEAPVARTRPPARGAAPGSGGLLILNVAVEPDPDGVPAGSLSAGDMVYASINDPRDIAQYLAKLFGGRSDEGTVPLAVPVEALERQDGRVTLRVRFSAGVCGDVTLPADIRLRAAPRGGRRPWWKKIFRGG